MAAWITQMGDFGKEKNFFLKNRRLPLSDEEGS
jgi:hypothetical protein